MVLRQFFHRLQTFRHSFNTSDTKLKSLSTGSTRHIILLQTFASHGQLSVRNKVKKVETEKERRRIQIARSCVFICNEQFLLPFVCLLSGVDSTLNVKQ